MGDPGRIPRITPEDVLDAFAMLDDRAEPLTAPELAEQLDCSRRTALNKLHTLEDQDAVASKKVGGRSKVWWIPLPADAPPTDDRAEHLAESERERPESAPTAEQGETPPPIPDAPSGQATVETPDDAIGDALDGWRPGRSAEGREQRREIGRRALEWLRARNAPATASDFKTALYEETHLDGQGEQSWWERVVREALQRAEDAGVVEYNHGRHEYQWIGEDFPTTGGTYDPTTEFEQ